MQAHIHGAKRTVRLAQVVDLFRDEQDPQFELITSVVRDITDYDVQQWKGKLHRAVARMEMEGLISVLFSPEEGENYLLTVRPKGRYADVFKTGLPESVLRHNAPIEPAYKQA